MFKNKYFLCSLPDRIWNVLQDKSRFITQLSGQVPSMPSCFHNFQIFFGFYFINLKWNVQVIGYISIFRLYKHYLIFCFYSITNTFYSPGNYSKYIFSKLLRTIFNSSTIPISPFCQEITEIINHAVSVAILFNAIFVLYHV